MAEDLKSLKDEELVKLFKEGKEQAFDELYFRYAPRLKKLIFYQLGDPDEANDVFHDVFLRFYKHVETFNVDRSFSSWIYKIAVNCCKNFKRKSIQKEIAIEKEKAQFDTEKRTTDASPEDIFIQKSDMKEFYEAVETLNDKFKAVFLLRFDHGLSYNVISDIVDCSERTAKWRMQRSIEKITDYLKDKGIV